MFLLGCLLHFCFTGGQHPFGPDVYEQIFNIMQGRPDLAALGAPGSGGEDAGNGGTVALACSDGPLLLQGGFCVTCYRPSALHEFGVCRCRRRGPGWSQCGGTCCGGGRRSS